MEKTLTVEKNESVQTRTNKTYHRILADGINYSAWDLEVAQKLQVGQTWVVDVEQKDQFWNIKGVVTQIQNAEIIPSGTPSISRVRDPEWGYNRRAALEKATMLAVAHGGAGHGLPSEDVMKVADEYFRWLSPNEEEGVI